MRFNGLAGAVVLDAQGRIQARIGSEVPFDDLADGQTSERVPLPGGGWLVGVRPAIEQPWARFVRAFIHEARSPLNALAIYLEVMAGRAGGDAEAGKTIASVLERAQSQIRRLDDLLRLFGGLAAPRPEDGTDLVPLVRAAGRFAAHEASRRGLRLDVVLPDGVTVPLAADAGAVADALVALLATALLVPEGSELRLELLVGEGEARLRLDSPGLDAARLKEAEAMLEAVGARLWQVPEGGLAADFVQAGAMARSSAGERA